MVLVEIESVTTSPARDTGGGGGGGEVGGGGGGFIVFVFNDTIEILESQCPSPFTM
jgi:hypothetical protein